MNVLPALVEIQILVQQPLLYLSAQSQFVLSPVCQSRTLISFLVNSPASNTVRIGFGEVLSALAVGWLKSGSKYTIVLSTLVKYVISNLLNE